MDLSEGWCVATTVEHKIRTPETTDMKLTLLIRKENLKTF